MKDAGDETRTLSLIDPGWAVKPEPFWGESLDTERLWFLSPDAPSRDLTILASFGANFPLARLGDASKEKNQDLR